MNVVDIDCMHSGFYVERFSRGWMDGVDARDGFNTLLYSLLQ